MRRGEAAGLRRRASGQRLVGAWDVGVGWSQRTLTDRLVDVFYRLEHTLPMASAQNQIQYLSIICSKCSVNVLFLCVLQVFIRA